MKKKLLATTLVLVYIGIALVAYLITRPAPDPSANFVALPADADWPQLQRDGARTGRTQSSMPPSRVRARWIWMGSDWILRNQNSKPGQATWDDDLTSAEGKNLSMPASVPWTFAETMQPIIMAGRIFVADTSAQKVWGLSLDDGSTLWEASNPGGTAWPGVATDTIVVFTSHYGYITAWNAANGTKLWQVDTGKTISSSPALAGNTVYTASQNGRVYAIELTTGRILWQRDTGAPIQGGIAVSSNKVYVGNDAMYAMALDAATGNELARQKLAGQSFRQLWPVVTGDKVIFHTVFTIAIGSEYVMNGIIGPTSGSFANEQATIRNWLAGSGKEWERVYSLDGTTLQKTYTVPLAAVGGVGNPAPPVVIDNAGRPLLWWPTYFPTLTRCSFGCPADGYHIDVKSFDLTNGNGISLPGTGTLITGVETDNTFGMTVGGNVLYLRQNFRGTKAIDLSAKTAHAISAEYRYRDQGGWPAPLNYAQGNKDTDVYPVYTPRTAKEHRGNMGPAITNGKIIFTERFGVTCMESY